MTVRYVKSVILASVMYYAPLLRLLFCPSDCLSNALELRVNTRLFCRIYLHHLISYGSGSVVEKQRENISDFKVHSEQTRVAVVQDRSRSFKRYQSKGRICDFLTWVIFCTVSVILRWKQRKSNCRFYPASPLIPKDSYMKFDTKN